MELNKTCNRVLFRMLYYGVTGKRIESKMTFLRQKNPQIKGKTLLSSGGRARSHAEKRSILRYYYYGIRITLQVRNSDSITCFPFGFFPLVVAPSPRMPPRLPLQGVLGRQVRCERALQHVGAAAYRVRRVAVIGTLTVEAHVLVGRDEECLQQVGRGHLGHQLGRDVHKSSADRHRSPKPQHPK